MFSDTWRGRSAKPKRRRNPPARRRICRHVWHVIDGIRDTGLRPMLSAREVGNPSSLQFKCISHGPEARVTVEPMTSTLPSPEPELSHVPELVTIPAGSFCMGADDTDDKFASVVEKHGIR